MLDVQKLPLFLLHITLTMAYSVYVSRSEVAADLITFFLYSASSYLVAFTESNDTLMFPSSLKFAVQQQIHAKCETWLIIRPRASSKVYFTTTQIRCKVPLYNIACLWEMYTLLIWKAIKMFYFSALALCWFQTVYSAHAQWWTFYYFLLDGCGIRSLDMSAWIS